MKKILLLLSLILLQQNLKAKDITIATSILPVQAIVSMVTDGVQEPNLILTNSSSPHHMELTFKQIQAIKNSNILFLVSRNLELPFLQYINNKKTKVIVLDELPNLNLYKFSANKFSAIKDNHNDEHSAKHNEEEHNERDHEHSEHNHAGDNHKEDQHNHIHIDKANINDYHMWLDPQKVKVALVEIAKELSKIYPENKNVYMANVKKYSEKLNNLNKNIKSILKGYNGNVMFFHNGWQYYIKAYNIKEFGTIIDHENGHSHSVDFSAKTIIELKEYVEKNKISCIFSEPEFENKSVENFSKKVGVKTALLQPIESYTFKNSPKINDYINIYFDLMEKNTRIIVACK